MLEYVEETLQEQEKTANYIEILQKENEKLKEDLNYYQHKHNSPMTSEDGNTETKHDNFDTFGGDSEDAVTKIKLKKSEEQVKMLKEEILSIKNIHSIEFKSKEQNVKNLTEKLKIAERSLEESEKCIQEMESHFKTEIDNMRKSFEHSKSNMQDALKVKDEYESKLKSCIQEKDSINTKYEQLRENYDTLDANCRETQSELDEFKSKYEKE